MVLYSNLKFEWGLAPSSTPPPPPCWASRCTWRSPWSFQQFSESSSIFSSNICMRFNLRYCFWISDNKQRNYTWCHGPLANSWWCTRMPIQIMMLWYFLETVWTDINYVILFPRDLKIAGAGFKQSQFSQQEGLNWDTFQHFISFSHDISGELPRPPPPLRSSTETN